jgi:glycosyltransferase involved in cell wall biosynthesis
MSQALAKTPGVERVTVLANEVQGAASRSREGAVEIERLWRLNEPSTFLQLGRAAARLKPDVVWVNAGIRTWGASRRASLAGASVPAALRLAGHQVVTTLHTIGDTVRLDRMGVGPVTRAGMHLASLAYLRSNLVTVTMPSMQAALMAGHGARNVVHLSHGSWGARVQRTPTPDAERILSFGFWGSFKDADLLVDAVTKLRARGRNTELVLGGGPHPYSPEIYQRLVKRLSPLPFVRFTGYVPEAEMDALFSSMSLVVLPYRTNAGASGVLNLCRSYGLPAVISDEAALLEQLHFEGGAALVFHDEATLVDGLEQVLSTPELRVSMGEQNLEVARRLTIDRQAGALSRLFSDLVHERPLERWLSPLAVGPRPRLSLDSATLVSWPPA